MSANTTTRPHHIYCLGVNLPDPEQETPLGKWPDIKYIVESDLERARRNGHPNTLQVLDCADMEGSLAEYERRLMEMKGSIDALMFGTGIRTKKDVLPFERVLGITIRVLGEDVSRDRDGTGAGQGDGGIRVLLNDGPDRHCWAIERAYGVTIGE